MKRLAIAFAGIACVVIGFSLIMVSAATMNTASNNSNHSSSINYSINLGQSLVLDSNEALQQKPEAYFPWNGTLVVTLVDCGEYENMQEAGIDSSSPFYRDGGPAPSSKWKYVQCSLKVENVDAVPEGDDGLFGIDAFGLFVEDSSSDFWDPTQSRPIEYFDGYVENATEKDHYRYELPIGEERLLTIGFWVEECDRSKPMYICAGLWDGATKYRFYLPIQNEG